GIDPWIVVIVALVACNGFMLPYQNTTYGDVPRHRGPPVQPRPGATAGDGVLAAGARRAGRERAALATDGSPLDVRYGEHRPPGPGKALPAGLPHGRCQRDERHLR